MGPGIAESSACAGALLRLAQAQGAPPPYMPASWISYGGDDAILLAIVLLVVASGFAYSGKRLRAPLEITRPGGTVAGFMIAIWLLAIYNVLVATLVYGLQVKQDYPGFVAPRVRVGTFVDAPVSFFVILYLTRRWGWKVALASAVIGAAAARMIFEFPFDLIIMARTNPPIPTHPMLYRQLFFLPLFLVQFSTLSLLTLLPSMRVTAYACYAVAGMFVVFAVWAAFGFAFPAEPLPLALNVIAKILCFLAAIILFVWRADGEVSGAGKWLANRADAIRLLGACAVQIACACWSILFPSCGHTLYSDANRPEQTRSEALINSPQRLLPAPASGCRRARCGSHERSSRECRWCG
jgi:hypothetical protein